MYMQHVCTQKVSLEDLFSEELLMSLHHGEICRCCHSSVVCRHSSCLCTEISPHSNFVVFLIQARCCRWVYRLQTEQFSQAGSSFQDKHSLNADSIPRRISCACSGFVQFSGRELRGMSVYNSLRSHKIYSLKRPLYSNPASQGLGSQQQ